MIKPITECQWIGPEQKIDGRPLIFCAKPVFPGKSYCPDHVWHVYAKGTNINNKRRIKQIEDELAEVKRLENIDVFD